MKSFITLLLIFISFTSQGIIMGNQPIKMISQAPMPMVPTGFIKQGPISSPFINQTPTIAPTLIKQDPLFINPQYLIPPTVPIGIKTDPLAIKHRIQPQMNIVQYPQPIYTQQPILTTFNPYINTNMITTTAAATMILPINATTARIVYPYNYVEQCRVTGIYKHLCLRQSDTTNYINTMFHKRYDCLKDAVCSFRAGKCQWLQTKKFKQCINNYQRLGYIGFKKQITSFPTTFLGEHY